MKLINKASDYLKADKALKTFWSKAKGSVDLQILLFCCLGLLMGVGTLSPLHGDGEIIELSDGIPFPAINDWDRDGLKDSWEKAWAATNSFSLPLPTGYPYAQFSTEAYSSGNMVGWWQLNDLLTAYQKPVVELKDRSPNYLPLTALVNDGHVSDLLSIWPVSDIPAGFDNPAVKQVLFPGSATYVGGGGSSRKDGVLKATVRRDKDAYSVHDFTFSAWVQKGPNSLTEVPIPGVMDQVIAEWRGTDGSGWKLGPVNPGEPGDVGGKVEAIFYPPGGGLGGSVFVKNSVGSGISITDGQWHHVVLTLQSKVGWAGWVATLYVDGGPEKMVVLPSTIYPTNPSNYVTKVDHFTIGGSSSVNFIQGQGWVPGAEINKPAANSFNGILDEVRFYNRGMKKAEVVLLPNTYADPDNDGLSNFLEQFYGSNPLKSDTDGDGIKDGDDPLPTDPYGDYDGDGLMDATEFFYQDLNHPGKYLDMYSEDTDGDGLGDGWEVKYGFDPLAFGALDYASNADPDHDGLTNEHESANGTDPWDACNGFEAKMGLQDPKNQTGLVSHQLVDPLMIYLYRDDGDAISSPLANQTVYIDVKQGGGKVSAQPNSLRYKTLSVQTDSSGTATVYFHLPSTPDETEISFKYNYGSVYSSGVKSVQDAYTVATTAGIPVKTGLQMWYRSDAGITRGTPNVEGAMVKQWDDLSGHGHHASQEDGADHPKPYYYTGSFNYDAYSDFFGKPVLSFGIGDDRKLDFDQVDTANFTVIVAYNYGDGKDKTFQRGGPISNRGDGHGFVVASGVNNPNLDLNSSLYTPHLEKWDGDNKVSKSVATPIQYAPHGYGPEVHTWTSDPDPNDPNETPGPHFYRNETEVAELEDVNLSSAKGATIGYANGHSCYGVIAEIAVFDRVLTESERQQCEEYMKKRYGLADSNGNGLTDGEDLAVGLDPSNVDDDGDFDNDGISDLSEVQNGLDPTNADENGNGILDGLELQLDAVEPLSQIGAPDHLVDLPWVVEVTKLGVPLIDVPVTFSISQGGGEFAATADGIFGASAVIKTDEQGRAQVYYKLPAGGSSTNEIVAQVTLADNSVLQAIFQAKGDGNLLPVADHLKMYLRSDAGVSLDSEKRVIKWADQSGNGNDATQLDDDYQERRPKYVSGEWNGRPVVRFTANESNDKSDRLNFSAIGLSNAEGNFSDFTVFVIYRMAEGSQAGSGPLSTGLDDYGHGLIMGGDDPYSAGQYPTDISEFYVPRLERRKTNDVLVSDKRALRTVPIPFKPQVHAWASDSETLEFYLNGENEEVVDAKAYNALGTHPAASFENDGRLGKANDQYMSGDIAAVCIYDRKLTADEIAQVTNYFADTYGLTDTDGDGLAAWEEIKMGLDPHNPDQNEDGILDGVSGDVVIGWDIDDLDGDGNKDEKIVVRLDPNNLFTYFFLTGNSEIAGQVTIEVNALNNDIDHDGLTNLEEYQLGSDPFWNDTDGDGVSDSQDKYPFDPTKSGIINDGKPPAILELYEPIGAKLVPWL